MNRQLDYDYARKNKQKINKRSFILLSYMFFNLKKKKMAQTFGKNTTLNHQNLLRTDVTSTTSRAGSPQSTELVASILNS